MRNPAQRPQHNGNVRRTPIAIVIALAVAACGTGDDDAVPTTVVASTEVPVEDEGVPDADAEPDAEPDATHTDSAPTTAPTSEPTVVEMTDAPCVTDLPSDQRAVSFPALGGFCVQIPEDVWVFTEADFVRLQQPDAPAAAVIARVAFAGGNTLTETADDLIEAIATGVEADVHPNGQTLSAFGVELDGYEIRGGTAASGPGILSTAPVGLASNAPWTPAPDADLFLAEVVGGVLLVGTVGSGDLEPARELLDDVLATAQLTTLDGTIDPPPDRSELPALDDIVPVEIDVAPRPDGATPLLDSFSPVTPGTYQLSNLGAERAVELEIGDDWFVAPNFPGFVVFAELPVIGPGLRDIVITDAARLTGVRQGAAANGPSRDVATIDDIIDSPPGRLIVSNVVTGVDVGGHTATRLDLAVDPASTCRTDDPCAFMLLASAAGFAKFISPGAVHRTWWIDGLPTGPLIISASTSEADIGWFDERVEPFVAGLVIGG